MSYIGFVIFSIIGIIISLAFLLFCFAGFFSFEVLIGTAYLIIMYLCIVIVLYRLCVKNDGL